MSTTKKTTEEPKTASKPKVKPVIQTLADMTTGELIALALHKFLQNMSGRYSFEWTSCHTAWVCYIMIGVGVSLLTHTIGGGLALMGFLGLLITAICSEGSSPRNRW